MLNKTKLTFLFAFLFTLSMSAQEIWIETGFKGGYGLPFLYNSNIGQDNTYQYVLSGGYGVGGKLGVNFGSWHGLALEAMFTNLRQDFEYRLPNSDSDLTNSINWKGLNAYLLYRYNRNRLYLELGPAYSTIGEISQNDNNTEIADVSANYTDNYLSGVFGFGGFLAGSNTFSVVMGIRLHYGFTDFVSAEGIAKSYPNPSHTYEAAATTNPVLALATIEFNFGVGKFARNACHERMRFQR